MNTATTAFKINAHIYIYIYMYIPKHHNPWQVWTWTGTWRIRIVASRSLYLLHRVWMVLQTKSRDSTRLGDLGCPSDIRRCSLWSNSSVSASRFISLQLHNHQNFHCCFVMIQLNCLELLPIEVRKDLGLFCCLGWRWHFPPRAQEPETPQNFGTRADCYSWTGQELAAILVCLQGSALARLRGASIPPTEARPARNASTSQRRVSVPKPACRTQIGAFAAESCGPACNVQIMLVPHVSILTSASKLRQEHGDHEV